MYEFRDLGNPLLFAASPRLVIWSVEIVAQLMENQSSYHHIRSNLSFIPIAVAEFNRSSIIPIIPMIPMIGWGSLEANAAPVPAAGEPQAPSVACNIE